MHPTNMSNHGLLHPIRDVRVAADILTGIHGGMVKHLSLQTGAA
jgi:hypothetical protein